MINIHFLKWKLKSITHHLASTIFIDTHKQIQHKQLQKKKVKS